MTFHDPCYLGRYEGVFDEPRAVLEAAGLAINEMPRRRERSYCCGGGSAGFAREQEVEVRVDQKRKEEIVATGATRLVTACPECKMMLDSAVEETVDLAELVAARSRARPRAPGGPDVLNAPPRRSGRYRRPAATMSAAGSCPRRALSFVPIQPVPIPSAPAPATGGSA